MKILRKILKYSLGYPYVLLRNRRETYLQKQSQKDYAILRYKRARKLVLDINHPNTLDEKIYFLCFNSDTTLWSDVTDKIKVRTYVENCGFKETLNELYSVYDCPKDIEYAKLPQSFVIKTNHASATNIFVKDKSTLNIRKTNKMLDEWLKMDFGLISATPHYSKIKPKILIEKYLTDENLINRISLADYKFFCFNGKPGCVFVLTDRIPNTHNVNRMFYDMDWLPHKEWLQIGQPIGRLIPKPKSFNKMVNIAEKLSELFPFVRVDLYEIEEKPIFGEMTFTPGWDESSQLFQEKFGSYIRL